MTTPEEQPAYVAGHLLPGGVVLERRAEGELSATRQHSRPATVAYVASLPEPGAADAVAVRQVLSHYSHAVDNGAWDELARVFTEDARFTIGDESVTGLPAIVDYLSGRGRLPTHHTVNTLARVEGDGGILTWSRLVTVAANGTAGSADLLDWFVRDGEGWRIRRREISPRFGGSVPQEYGGEPR